MPLKLLSIHYGQELADFLVLARQQQPSDTIFISQRWGCIEKGSLDLRWEAASRLARGKDNRRHEKRKKLKTHWLIKSTAACFVIHIKFRVEVAACSPNPPTFWINCHLIAAWVIISAHTGSLLFNVSYRFVTQVAHLNICLAHTCASFFLSLNFSSLHPLRLHRGIYSFSVACFPVKLMSHI